MKGKALFLSALLLAACLAGCVPSLSAPAANTIQPFSMTSEQERVFHMISNRNQEVRLYDFTVGASYRKAEFWVEIYTPDGTERFAHLDLAPKEVQPLEGQLCFLTLRTTMGSRQWSITYVENGSMSTQTSGRADQTFDTSSGTRLELEGPVPIESGKEILLYAMFFFHNTGDELPVMHELQEYAAQPQLLEDYVYVHMLKARFTE